MVDLKSCPFCGGEASRYGAAIGCSACGFTMSARWSRDVVKKTSTSEQRFALSQADCACRWNRRAPVSAGKVKAIAEAAIRDCEAGAPISAANLARDVLAALQPGDGWQGIESAPKDGEPFLAALKTGHLWDFAVMLWHEGEEDWTDSFGAIIGYPTHWMPLPAPPASLPQGEETR